MDVRVSKDINAALDSDQRNMHRYDVCGSEV